MFESQHGRDVLHMLIDQNSMKTLLTSKDTIFSCKKKFDSLIGKIKL